MKWKKIIKKVFQKIWYSQRVHIIIQGWHKGQGTEIFPQLLWARPTGCFHGKQKEKCYLICSGRNGQQRVMYVHSLNFKATFHVLRRRPHHCQNCTIVFAIVLIAVTVSTHLYVDCRHFICFMSLFQDHVVCHNFILTGHQGTSGTQATKISSCHVQHTFNYLRGGWSWTARKFMWSSIL